MNPAPLTVGFHADKMIVLGHVPLLVVDNEVVWWSGNNYYVVDLDRGLPSGFAIGQEIVLPRPIGPAFRSGKPPLFATHGRRIISV